MATLTGDEPELQLGDSGEHVSQLQDRLRGLRLLDKAPDGTYDDATEAAVRQVQSDLGHEPDGRVTQNTWQSLDQHMISNGLEYNHYAGPGQQHWDLGEPPPSQQPGDPAAGPAGPVDNMPVFDPNSHQVSEEGQHFWDGGQWQPLTDADKDAHAHHLAQHAPSPSSSSAAEATGSAAGAGAADAGGGGQLSPDGNYRWDGNEWQPVNGADPAAAAGSHAGHAGAEEAEAAPDVPHIDNIHPAIRDDPRFSDFHDFLREHHGA